MVILREQAINFRAYIAGRLKINKNTKSATLFFHQVGQIWSYRGLVNAGWSSRRDLQSEHGFEACSLKNKGKIVGVRTFGSQKKWEKNENLNEIGQILVSGGLDGWKWMREAGPDRFLDSPASKTLKMT